ncbi:hypothetical protein HCZ23_00835 [Celeribacter sp. HF31]|uniref:SPOR domain-containing protein n=1 Tax=Celeribacter sp. HF31 TaxID=2721558 RepID=UPI0014314201|nr:SPOR domain-containing protein [Celeribacter sp. HF31]NIY78017.1 hypothetical protein [Celeribacter sp. HF31]
MQGLRTISVAVMVATLGVSAIGLSGAGARTLYDADHPAEFPPASYKGSQYVDSRGCAYVRAGSGGTVQWVPRVSRDRRVLCGFKPTFAQLEDSLPVIPDPVTPTTTVAEAAAPASKQPPAVRVSAPTSAPSSAPQAAPVAAKAAPAPQPSLPPLEQLAGKTVGERGCVASVTDGQLRCETGTVEYILKRLPAGVTVRTADGGRMTTTEPTLVRVPVKRAAPVQAPVEAPAPILVAEAAPATVVPSAAAALTQCGGLSGNAAQYMNTTGRYAVRCGPQAVHPSAYIQRKAQTRLSTQSANQIAVARAAGIDPYALPRPVTGTLPKGYSRAWTDGRLNPHRGPQTARGDLQMAQVWTQTTPAYDLYAPRKKTFWEWLFGSPFKTRNTVTVQAPQYAGQGQAPVQISTKSVVPARTPGAAKPALAQVQPQQQAQALRYVQVGTFGVPENAERSIARLSAMGYPVSSQVLRRGGKPLKIVLAGPFARPEQTLSALSAVRGAGYGDAFARK